MNEVRVNKQELMEKVRANRDAHRGIFEEAVEGYRKEAVRLLEEHIDRIKSGSISRLQIVLPAPEDHTDDYDRVLAMLAMHLQDDVVINQNDFACYVMDDWIWTGQFLSTNSAYSATAARISSRSL